MAADAEVGSGDAEFALGWRYNPFHNENGWLWGAGPCAIACQAKTKLNDIIGAIDCLAKTNASSWSILPLRKFATHHLDRSAWLRYHYPTG
jgi:hypothetical protein